MEQKEGIDAKEREKIIKSTKEALRREDTQKTSIKEGISVSVMDGAGLRYMTPYALAVGANNTQIGLLTSIPILLGNFSQLFTSKAIEKYSRKKIIVISAFIQALIWIPIILVGYFFFYKGLDHGISATLVIVFYTLFIIFGAFLSPAWNSMMKDIVLKGRGSYFAKRNRIMTAVALVVMLACGLVLNYFKKLNLLFFGFLALFGIAFIARLVSGYLLSKHYDPKLKLQKSYYFTLVSFIKRIPKSNFGKFAVFISLITFGAAIASPFFSVYMLKNLNFSYIVWTVVIISNSLSAFVSMPIWGKFADRFGNLRVLRWTGILVSPIPILWLLTILLVKINIPLVIGYLIVLELFSGFIWSGFNLCAINFIYDAVTREKLALCIAYYNVFNGVAVFIGATLGGILASSSINFFGLSPILFVFLLSGIMRFFAYMLMAPKVREVREVETYKEGEFEKEVKKMLLPSPFRFIRHHHNHSSAFGVNKHL